MNTPPSASPRTVSRKPATKPTVEQIPPFFCPHVDAELDEAVVFDVADFDELRLMSAASGESTRPLTLAAELP